MTRRPKNITIRSSTHSLKFANQAKRDVVDVFIAEYRRVLQLIIDQVWTSKIKIGKSYFHVAENKLDCPMLIPAEFLQHDTTLSARALQCCGKQASAMIRAAVRKRAKQLYMLRKLQKEGEDTRKLQRKIDIQPLVKPSANNANVELDSRFVDFKSEASHFDLFCRLSSLGQHQLAKLPIKHTRVSRKWLSQGFLKPVVRLTPNTLILLFDVTKTPIKDAGKIVGCDQGVKTVVTLSDKQTTKSCCHQHNLGAIQVTLARRKSGSLNFQRAQQHRKNYINWSLNQLDFSTIKQIKLEKICDLRRGKNTSRSLKHWTYTLIKQKLFRLGEEEGFLVTEVSNEFRSQRCSSCGWVRKANRKDKTFKCNLCGFQEDSDLNAAFNLELDLCEVPFWVRQQKLNLKGFYWKPDGLFDVGQEPIVPGTNKIQWKE